MRRTLQQMKNETDEGLQDLERARAGAGFSSGAFGAAGAPDAAGLVPLQGGSSSSSSSARGNNSPSAKRQKLEPAVDISLGQIQGKGPAGVAGVMQSGATPPLDAEKAFWFYYFDAHEDVNAKTGACRIVLFGKVPFEQGFKTCCCVVNNMQRNVFLLLKKQGMSADEHKVAAEEAFNEYREKELKRVFRGGNDGLSRATWKPVKRKYVFEREISHPHGELQFCKVVFDGAVAQTGTAAGTAYTDVFGVSTSFLEMLLKKRSIQGPMWLRVYAPAHTAERLGHCCFEAHVASHKQLFSKADLVKKNVVARVPAKDPPLRVAALSVKTIQKRKGGEHEPAFLGIALLGQELDVDAPAPVQQLQNQFQTWGILRKFKDEKGGFSAFEKAKNYNVPPGIIIHTAETEAGMLRAFVSQLAEADPDVIVAHNAYGFALDILGSRLAREKIGDWHRVSRLRRQGSFNYRKGVGGGQFMGRTLTIGRIVVDTLLGARDLMSKQTNYEVPTLASALFGVAIPSPPLTEDMYNTKDCLSYFLKYSCDEAKLFFMIMHKLELLSLTKQLTCVGGNLWAHSLMNKRAERNEYLLIHEFHGEKFITPDKSDMLVKKGGGGGGADLGDDDAPAPAKAKGPAYSGGLVLEPKVNLYDEFVLLLDFNSLYPSLIQEYNLCFSTVQRPRGDRINNMTEQELLAATEAPKSVDAKNEGILPRVVRRLVGNRKTVKTELKKTVDPSKKAALEIKQKALKLVANSLYGTLGFSHSRFHVRSIAALITQRGRAALGETQQLIEQLHYEVVYGDTDSVFVRTGIKDDYAAACQIATQIKSEVNKKYKKLEIDLDGVFQRLLLLKKKKYAGLKVDDWKAGKTSHEFKGLDLVRRDWCKLSAEMGTEILEVVLSGRFADAEQLVEHIHTYLSAKRKEMDEGKIDRKLYVITKALSKMPHEYADAKAQAHVEVAARMIRELGKTVNAGMEIPYMMAIKKGEDGATPAPYHPAEIESANGELVVDIEWYVKSQLHPPLARLLIPIEGTDNAKIAEALGMDASKFQAAFGSGAEFGGVAFAGEDTSALIDQLVNPLTKWKSKHLVFDIACPACQKGAPLRQILGLNEDLRPTGERVLCCPHCDAFLGGARVCQQTLHAIRRIYLQWAEGVTVCSEPTCCRVSRTLSLSSNGQRCENPFCNATVNEQLTQSMVQDQLDLAMMLVSLALESEVLRKPSSKGRKSLQRLHDQLEMYSWESSFNVIHVGELFRAVFVH